jgi:hypothetical protein
MGYHHAAALALAGWYLISPPVIDGKVRPDLPINRWKVSKQEFADARQCNRYRDNYLKAWSDAFSKESDKVPRSMIEAIIEEKNKNTRCVRSNDIGLAK